MSTLFGALPLWAFWAIYLLQIAVFIYNGAKRRKEPLPKIMVGIGLLLATLTHIGILSNKKNLFPQKIQNIIDFIIIFSYLVFLFVLAFRSAPAEKKRMLIICSGVAVVAFATIFGIIFFG